MRESPADPGREYHSITRDHHQADRRRTPPCNISYSSTDETGVISLVYPVERYLMSETRGGMRWRA